ncbi:hypothetical protein EJ110_NYTH41833 [Nymphaea thermarum]|nr:hypothetical protein EJ110_NYTH41833 [Nymphaea thermarum]
MALDSAFGYNLTFHYDGSFLMDAPSDNADHEENMKYHIPTEAGSLLSSPTLLIFLPASLKEMVKFSKQFEAQLVPEWKEAFVDYRQLKKELRKLQKLKQNQEKEALTVTKDARKRTCCFSLSSFPRMSPLVRRLCGRSPKDHGAIQALPLTFLTL